jgi:hypothetical protein
MSELFCLGKTFNPNLVCLGKTFDSNLRESQVNLLTRRAFTAAALVAGASTFVPALGAPLNVAEIDRRRVIRLADQAMKLVPRTITAVQVGCMTIIRKAIIGGQIQLILVAPTFGVMASLTRINLTLTAM